MPSARNATASRTPANKGAATSSKATKRTSASRNDRASSGQESNFLKIYDVLRYHVVPPIFVVFFTLAAQLLMVQGNPTAPFQWDRIWGNAFSWKVMAVFMVWALVFLKIPSETFNGPATSFGYVPVYSANGFLYFSASLLTYLALHWPYPELSVDIYSNMPYILGSLNIFALVFCAVLLIMGKYAPQTNEKMNRYPLIYEYYRGMEVHPRLLGVDVKQWTNCRVGMMSWQILIVAFLLASYKQTGVLSAGHAVNVLLQTIYIAKFFWWETGYFTTLDITLDRAGYYICWGCLVWVPGFYTYSSFYLVAHRSFFGNSVAFIVALLGFLSILMNYRVDYEKQLFRATDGKCRLWGRQVRYMEVEDHSSDAKKPSKLLLSGCWGVARHLNYDFEILAAFFWSVPACGHGVWPFLYVLFLVGLLVHRVFRDEEKCAKKYGKYWPKYCQSVPYRMIPYVF